MMLSSCAVAPLMSNLQPSGREECESKDGIAANTHSHWTSSLFDIVLLGCLMAPVHAC